MPYEIWWSMVGRALKIRPTPKALYDSVMHTSVVEWSKFSKNQNNLSKTLLSIRLRLYPKSVIILHA